MREVEFLERKGWGIFNGNIRGDQEGGRGNSVIDYAIGKFGKEWRKCGLEIE